jgi:NitT/TauT family transport system substrate-binding protein
MKTARIALPDLVSNSYFPVLAAIELGCFHEAGLDARFEHIFPSQKAFAALAEGMVDFVAAPAHALLPAFPEWRGVKLLASLSQGLIWLLVLRKDLAAVPGDPNSAKGRKIGAAPMVDLALRQVLLSAGLDFDRDRISIVPVPGAQAPGASFGIAAAHALDEGLIDGFWANGLGAEHAVQTGSGDIILDIRRGLGPAAAFHYSFPAFVASQTMIADQPETCERALRAIIRAQQMLKADLGLATRIGEKLFPAAEAKHIADVVARDLPFYTPEISSEASGGLVHFAKACGLLRGTPNHEDIVEMRFSHLWAAGESPERAQR